MGKKHDTTRKKFGKKGKATGYIFIPGTQFHEAEIHLKMRSYIHNDIINSAPSIGKYMNKHELYRKCPPRRVKYKITNEIKNETCVINFTTVTPVLKKK